MLRDLLRLGRAAAGGGGSTGVFAACSSMTDDAGVVLGVGPSPPASALPAAAHMGTGASAEQQASCLITSCTRKLEKRKAAGAAEAGPAHAQLGAAGSAPSSAHTAPQQLVRSNSKRSKGDALVQQQQQQQQQQPAAFSSGSDTAVYMDDQACAPHARPQQQELLQLLAAQQQGTGSRPEQQQQAACSTLGSMLAPLYAWVPARSSSLDERQRCSTGPRSARSAPAQEEDEHLEGDEDGDGAWLDENLACSEGRLTSPSTSGTPSCVSVPHSTAGTAPHKQQLQQQQPSSGAAASGAGVQASVPSGSGATCAAAHVADGDGAAVVVSSGRNCADEPTDDADFDEDDFDPFLFIGSLGPVEAYAPPGRQPLLPRQTRACKQKTLVLDLDETLVHSTLEPCGAEGADFSFQVTFNGCDHMVHVRTRPHMQAFLERCAALFEVVVFTASQKVYAEKLLNILDPQRTLIRHRIYRDSCVYVDGNYLKDLSVLGRDLSRCAIVDNSPQAFGFQLANGIPIESWYDDPDDLELPALLPFLEEIACVAVRDVRPAIKARFNLAARVAAAGHRVALAAAAARQQQGLWQAEQEQQQQQAVAVMAAQVAGVAAGVLQTQGLPRMAVQMVLQTHAQEQAA